MSVRPSTERLVQNCPSLPDRLARSIKLTFLVILPLLTVAWALSGCGGSNKAQERYSAGIELQNQGLLEEAIAEYDEAISIDPDFVEAYSSRGVAYALLNEDEKAIQDFSEAIRLSPDSADVYKNRGDIYFRQGEFQRAVEDYDEAIRLTPRLSQPSIDVGFAYGELGGEARPDTRTAMQSYATSTAL